MPKGRHLQDGPAWATIGPIDKSRSARQRNPPPSSVSPGKHIEDPAMVGDVSVGSPELRLGDADKSHRRPEIDKDTR